MQKQTIKKERETIPSTYYDMSTIDWNNKEKAGEQLSDALEEALLDAKKNGFLSLEEVKRRVGLL